MKCSIKGCHRKATRGLRDRVFPYKKKATPLCAYHDKDGNIFPSMEQEYKRTYHWKWAGIDITLREYNIKLAEQDNCCMICGKDFATMKCRAHVDHNHKTMQVRGALCPRCNTLVEWVENGLVDKAKDYLEYWNKP